ncbi:FtsK/SpoIIIE family DNA translocase [Deinococcus arenicola]|uniref:DNA translocase FtsK n=1 Tax=Deinococcus arenicola TaxID=2994950 RepID=A0ABU4DSB8_9DEIO|nr:DNA translocase FtsK [Deinococcus sp. ZS9-10]MDV6375283.1 DNA translocase FtsK [Deinococcus sp. ZS9-10]
MSKARAKSAPPVSRFDGEALGLVLFALGIFLAVTLLLPGGSGAAQGSGVAGGAAGFMTGTRALLLGAVGWGAYLLPIIPIAYGALVFLSRDLRNLTRRVLGGVIVVASLLALHEVFVPGAAGQGAAFVMRPLLQVLSYAALILPLITLTLGLELMLRLAPFSLLKTLFRRLSLLLSGASALVQGAVEGRQDGLESARARGGVRAGLTAHSRELDTLRRLYPDSQELKTWQGELKAAGRELRKHDEAGLKGLERDLKHWQEGTRIFVGNAARDLRGQVGREAPDAGADAEAAAAEIRQGRHELSVGLPSTQACDALERLRRGLVSEIQRLSGRAGKLERERQAAEKALVKPDSAVLVHEWPAHRERQVAWQEITRDFAPWRARADVYPGWPDLAAAFDRAPTEVAAELATALTEAPDDTLREQDRWRQRLTQAGEDAHRRAEAITDSAHAEGPQGAEQDAEQNAAPPALDFNFVNDEFSMREGAAGSAHTSTITARAHGVTDAAGWGAPPAAAPSAAPRPQADTGGVDPFDDWDDDDLPFGPSTRPASPALEAVPGRATEPLLGGGGVRAGEPRPGPLPWENAVSVPTGGRPGQGQAVQGKPAPPKPERRPVNPIGAIALTLPGDRLLDPIPAAAHNTAALEVSARQRAGLIDQTLRHFGLQAKVVDYARGPTVTRYEIEPAPGEKISRIASLSNDLARALAVGGVRVEAPVPGKSVIGLEVPNAEREPVTFHQAVSSPGFRNTRAKLPVILGKSIDGDLLVGDLAKMPHLLVAGSTGSGKSVCVNTLITSLLFKYLPTDLRFLMIDPKMVELTPYDGIPHLVRSVVTNPVDAAGVLLGAVAHMERRYKMMSAVGAKNLEQYNAKMRQTGETELPHLVIIIDELADLMITSPKEVESAIMRLAQMARATGMHLILATQRPSVDILTSLIKVNVPARIAFAVSSSHDSRTILDSMGAERLTGMGDMLFYQPGQVKPVRLQGPYISESESVRISDELRRMVFDDDFVEAYGADFDSEIMSSGPGDRSGMDFSDPLLRQAAQICIEEGQGSVSRLQRRLSVGHARAGKLMDLLEAMGIVSKHQGSKPRDVLATEADLPEHFG